MRLPPVLARLFSIKPFPDNPIIKVGADPLLPPERLTIDKCSMKSKVLLHFLYPAHREDTDFQQLFASCQCGGFRLPFPGVIVKVTDQKRECEHNYLAAMELIFAYDLGEETEVIAREALNDEKKLLVIGSFGPGCLVTDNLDVGTIIRPDIHPKRFGNVYEVLQFLYSQDAIENMNFATVTPETPFEIIGVDKNYIREPQSELPLE